MTSWSNYTVLPVATLVILGIWFSHIETATAAPCKCVTPAAGAPVYPFDPCYSAGFFKSNTTLRATSATVATAVLPYDYYQCVPYGATFLRYTQRCSTKYNFYKIGATDELYFNAFDNSTKKCTSKLPDGATPYECELPPMCS